MPRRGHTTAALATDTSAIAQAVLGHPDDAEIRSGGEATGMPFPPSHP